nr:immunoglobulin light chain junction region [Macaca mulatta]
CLQGYRTPLTF